MILNPILIFFVLLCVENIHLVNDDVIRANLKVLLRGKLLTERDMSQLWMESHSGWQTLNKLQSGAS